MISTPLCQLLGIQYPVLQGGMAWVADASLAAAVSNAGGLGIVSAMNADAQWVREEIRKTKALTNKPFGVNIMLMSRYADQVAQVVVEEGVPVVTTGAGNPSKYMPQWLEAGIKVIPVVPSTGVAKLVEKHGAAAVIAEGGESGGHIGEMNTMPLVPLVCDAVSIPVIAAGGIADGRGLAAALMLGACGVQMGTRFLVAKECSVHPNYKNKVLKAKDTSTISTGRRLGHPIRSLKNPFSREFQKKEFDPYMDEQTLEAMGIGALRAAAQQGDEEKGCFMAGESAALVTKEETAREIVLDVVNGAETVLRGAEQWLVK